MDVVGVTRLERAASCTPCMRSSQLSYTPFSCRKIMRGQYSNEEKNFQEERGVRIRVPFHSKTASGETVFERSESEQQTDTPRHHVGRRSQKRLNESARDGDVSVPRDMVVEYGLLSARDGSLLSMKEAKNAVNGFHLRNLLLTKDCIPEVGQRARKRTVVVTSTCPSSRDLSPCTSTRTGDPARNCAGAVRRGVGPR